jgi:benzoate/toluate 1,2-dioxygenase alpha subunit
MRYSDTELAALVEDGRVYRDVYTDQEVFELEMERLFARAWVYVGHTSQIKRPGDYITTEIGGEPVIMVRHSDDSIRVIRNRCSHRGAKVAVGRRGHVEEFHCAFHGYTFKTDGTLSAIQLEDAYAGTEFDRCNPLMNMQALAAVDDYRGFVFARLQGDGPDLESWLGDIKVSFDNITDRSPDGELEVVGELVRWVNHCNWKLLTENIVDGAHVAAVHSSIAQTASRLAKGYEAPEEIPPILQMAQSFWKTPSWIRKMGTTIVTNGHSYNGGNVRFHNEMSDLPDYLDAMEKPTGRSEPKKSCPCNVTTLASIRTCTSSAWYRNCECSNRSRQTKP